MLAKITHKSNDKGGCEKANYAEDFIGKNVYAANSKRHAMR